MELVVVIKQRKRNCRNNFINLKYKFSRLVGDMYHVMFRLFIFEIAS